MIISLPASPPFSRLTVSHSFVYFGTDVYMAHGFPFRRRSRLQSIVVRSSLNPSPSIDQEIMKIVSEFINEASDSVPAIRTYENDLCRLTVVGSVSLDQALTAAAADGGKVAEAHICRGLHTMAVEALFPATPDKHSTISTRLFLPVSMVNKRAKKIRNTLSSDALVNTTSDYMLSSSFRQVVLEHMWSFELVIFSAGSKREAKDLSTPRKALPCCSLSSSDSKILGDIAEAVCSWALESTARDFLKNMQKMPDKVFTWLSGPKTVNPAGSSVHIYKMSEEEIVEMAVQLIGNVNWPRQMNSHTEVKPQDNWLLFPASSRFARIGGPGFSSWASEFVAAYKLQVNGDEFEDLKFNGWQNSVDNRWEVFLSHMQMVELVGIFDIYYEDQFTIPDKEPLHGLIADLTKVGESKRRYSLLKKLCMTIAGGFFLSLFGAIVPFHQSHLLKGTEFLAKDSSISLEAELFKHQNLEAVEVADLCRSIVTLIKEALGWNGDIIVDPEFGAWIGELPRFLKECCLYSVQSREVAVSPNSADHTHGHTSCSPVKITSDCRIRAAQDICAYQVVLSQEGKIIGFMPTSRVAVNHWASNPLAAALYGGRKLTPGLLEPGLKIPQPSATVELELLISLSTAVKFALVRPV